MEVLGPIISVVECVSPHVAKRWEYHRDFEKYRDTLREVKDKLSCRKADIESELKTKLVPGETEEKREVLNWLERVENIFREIEEIEKEVRDVKFFSRARLGRKISEKKLKVDELYEEGVFPEGSLVRSLPQRGVLRTPPAMRDGDTTLKRTRDKIWTCLLDEKVTKIGIYGIGGAGKTTVVDHINNRLLEEKDKFDKVIWVTVSNNSSIKILQGKLAGKLDIDLSRYDDEESRAQKLHQSILNSKRCVLILDDLWKVEHDTLKKVGIPDFVPVNGCKLILTTRFLDVCQMVKCDAQIVMDLLSDQEALDMFLENVGLDVSSNPKLKDLAKQVARECARLPLAIVVISRALRNKTDPNEWEVALAELKDATVSESSGSIMSHLKKSYDWLRDDKLKDCLLFCALYPEDHSIERSLLVDQLISVGIVEDIKTRRYQVAKGQVMLNDLISSCLLSKSSTDKGAPCVKMHDLIRDMAIQIMCGTSCRSLVRAGEELELIPCEEYWSEDLKNVTLMENNIVEISSSIEPPKCPRISTLFLNSNPQLRSIPDNFFSHMKGLGVLNLSETAITSLPESVSDLVSLAMLLLKGCSDLTYIPSLSKLKNMKRLDLNKTGIVEVPKGIEMMVKLTHLNLSETNIQLIHDGILCNLTNLHFFSILNDIKITVRVNDLSHLMKLETFEASLDFKSFETALRCFEKESREHNSMCLLVLPDGEWNDARMESNHLFIRKSKIECELPFLLPKVIELLWIDDCSFFVSSLSRLFSFDEEANLTEINIERCTYIEHVFHYSPSIFPLLQKLVKLELWFLDDLHGLVCMEEALPLSSFSSLAELRVDSCPRLKKLFVLRDAWSLPNLEIVKIAHCSELEELVSVESDAITISLPKLRDISLSDLPKLKSIPFEAVSLREIGVHNCPMLEKIYPIAKEPYPPSLEYVVVDYHGWKSEDGMKWDWNDFNAMKEMEYAFEDEGYGSISEYEENVSISEDEENDNISEDSS